MKRSRAAPFLARRVISWVSLKVTTVLHCKKQCFDPDFGRDVNPGQGEKAWFNPGVWRKSGEGAKIAKIRGGGKIERWSP